MRSHLVRTATNLHRNDAEDGDDSDSDMTKKKGRMKIADDLSDRLQRTDPEYCCSSCADCW
jgi:hypothetical protein